MALIVHTFSTPVKNLYTTHLILYADTMTLISAYQISKSFASKNLFKSLSFGIDSGQRIGLIGPNGAGKSTLLKILAGQIDADGGKITKSNQLRLGYLTQKPLLDGEKSIYDLIIESSSDPYDGQNIAQAYELITKMELDRFPEKEFTLVKNLSGGWQKRVALACELMKNPNLLLLDEPTNHLDIQSILWLENFILNNTEMSFVVITHDRAFLQKITNVVFDLDPQNPDGLIKSVGTYAQFLETKTLLLDGQKRLEEKRRNTMLIEKEWLARGPQARLTKQKARINRAHDLIDEVDHLERKNASRKIEFDFGTTGKSPKKLIELKNVSKSFGSHNLFQNLSHTIRPGDRIGIIGRNGAGKSTLMKIMLGLEPATSGEAFVNPDIQIYYFEQQKHHLDQNETVLQVICPEGDYVHFQGKPVFARSYLSRFRFTPLQMDMPVRQLSGGEQSRLLIAKIMLNAAHVLVLDEPTNDLDVETLDVLTECLGDFEGALILVSHDRYFLDQNTSEIWAIDSEKSSEIVKFADYFQWENWQTSTSSKNQISEEKNDSSKKSETTKKQKLSYKELRELETIESDIAVKESELSELSKLIVSPDVATDFTKLSEISSKISQLEKDIPAMYDRWQDLESRKT